MAEFFAYLRREGVLKPLPAKPGDRNGSPEMMGETEMRHVSEKAGESGAESSGADQDAMKPSP